MLARFTPRTWRQAFATLALVLFAFQNYIAQTHVHLLWQGTPDAFVHALTDKTDPARWQKLAPDQHSPADDPANCPICQDIALAGHFMTPAVIVFPLPHLIAIVTARFALATAPHRVASHSWYSRGPPQG